MPAGYRTFGRVDPAASRVKEEVLMATTTDTSTRTHEAKRPLSPAAGPYGHPFHPILVTIPIGAWVGSLVFDIATRAGDGSRALTEASYWLIGLGILGALLAAVFGLMDLLRIPRGSRALKFGLTHMLLNLTVVALFIVNFFWRHGSYDDSARVSVGQMVLSIVAIALLLVSGWLGGTLTYRYGVRVAAEADQAEGYAP
jgi:uncharacterized membrane protein